MAVPTLLQTVLAVVFAALGFVGFWVSIHPPSTPRRKWTYLGIFVVLTVFGVVLVFWQARLAERSQLVADKAANELRRQVAELYRTQTLNGRPSQEEVDSLADRVYILRRDAKFNFGADYDLRFQARLLSAEILLFVAERAKNALRVEPLDGSEGVSRLIDDMKRPPVTEPLAPHEMLQEAHRLNQTVWLDRQRLTDEEERWLARNQSAISYYSDTRRLFREKFDRRLQRVADDLLKAGIIEKWWHIRAFTSYQNNTLGMREIGAKLAEAAERLPS